MKLLLPLFIGLLLFVLLSCSTFSDKEHNAHLPYIKELVESDADSAYMLLSEIIYSDSPNKSDLSEYILLLTDIDIKKGRYLLSNDSLLSIALRTFKKQNNTLQEGKALFNKGQLWAGLSSNEDALNYYLQAADRIGKANDRKLLATIYSKIAEVYFDDFLFDEALKTLETAYELDSLEGVKKNMALSLDKIGQAYLYLEEPDKTLAYFNKAESLANELNDSTNLKGYIYNNLGVYYSIIGNSEKALEYIKKAIRHTRKGDEMERNYLVLGEAYIVQRQYDSARYYLNRSATANDIYTKATSQYRLHELEVLLENYKDAIQHLVEFQTTSDSILETKYKAKTEKLAYQYNVERAVYEANTQNKIANLILAGLFLILFLFTVIFFIWRDKKRQLQKKEKEKEILNIQKEILKKEKEIGQLQQKLNIANTNLSAFKEFETDIAQYEQQIEKKKEELFQLLTTDINNGCERFKKRPIYKRIIELSDQEKDKDTKILTYSEQEMLDREMNKIFSYFITEIKNSFPSLTDDDIKMCCLSLLKLDTNTISLCFAVSGANAIKQRRSRIKRKMTNDSGNTLMYNFVFSAVKKGRD